MCVLKEVYRLLPSFFGGSKVANQEIQLGNYTIDKGKISLDFLHQKTGRGRQKLQINRGTIVADKKLVRLIQLR